MIVGKIEATAGVTCGSDAAAAREPRNCTILGARSIFYFSFLSRSRLFVLEGKADPGQQLPLPPGQQEG